MARVSFLLLLLLLHALASLLCATVSVADTADVEFIRSSCRSTGYPAVCVQSLAGHASTVHRSRRLLARAALEVTLGLAQSDSAFLRGVPAGSRVSGGVVDGCIFYVEDSELSLRKSRGELARMPPRGSPDFSTHMSNLNTWVSAAATGPMMCLEEISRSPVDPPDIQAAIRGRISLLDQVTNNALDLILGID